MRVAGRVNWFNSSRGFGFLTPDGTDQTDCFVHHTALPAEGTRELSPGERVEFDVVQGIKGPAAENVVRLVALPSGEEG
jgi:CspA family cold shock protein